MLNGSKRRNNREQEVSEISRNCKLIAKTEKVPIIALSQLSRALEVRGGDKRPRLSDLRDSGAIEQDADTVIFLYRPEYYKIMEDETGSPTNNLCELIVAKNRDGELKTIKTAFRKETFSFSDW